MAYITGLTNTQLRASAVPVSGTVAVTGTFWQATQPVSGTVTVGNASLAVTGTFWQATQPVSIAATVAVSGPLTDTQLRATAVPVSLTSTTVTGNVAVTGTFWQATQPVSGTFWQATQPVSIAATVAVSGPLTDTQLRATAVPVSGTFFQATQPVSGTFWQATQPVSGTFWQATQPISAASLPLPAGASTETTLAAVNTKTPALGQAVMASSVPVVVASNQTAIPVSMSSPAALFRGRTQTFRTPGRAGTTGQKLFALHNATGSTRTVTINQITIDLYQTAAKAVTVAPPIIRIQRFTALPTGGTALGKVSKDTSLTSSASVTAWGNASADGTNSGTILAVTVPADSMLAQEYAARLITAAGYETFDREHFLEGAEVLLGPLEGIVVELVYTLATQNPVTDMWIVGCDWNEN